MAEEEGTSGANTGGERALPPESEGDAAQPATAPTEDVATEPVESAAEPEQSTAENPPAEPEKPVAEDAPATDEASVGGAAEGAAPAEQAAPTEAAERAADASDSDLDLDDDDGDGITASAPAATAGSSAASDDDLDLDDSEEELAAVKKKRKRASNKFIEDSADESDDEGGTAAGEDEDDPEDDNQYKIDGFVVDQADEEDDARETETKATEDGEESEEDEETRMARKRKQQERLEQEAEDMVSELKELARDQDIEIETGQTRKRLKKRADGAGDKDLEQELDRVIERDPAAEDEDDMLDEEEAQQSIQAEYRHEHADMFDMSEYDQMGDINDDEDDGDQAEEEEEDTAQQQKDAIVDDDDEVDEKYKHISKADLEDNFMTKLDKQIEYADIPERLNLHLRGQHRPLLGGEPLKDDELEEEAQWILSRAFDTRPPETLDVRTVANVLRHALVDKEDLPHIVRYRKPSITRGDRVLLQEADLWKILRWDARWDHFSHRHKKLLAAAAKLGDELDDDYLQMLNEAQKDEHLTDMEMFLKLQTQMHGAETAKGPKGAVAKAQAAGLGKLVEQFGLTAFQFGVNVSVGMKKHDVVDSERMPEDLAQDFVCELYSDTDSVLRGSCNMLARQIADEPHVRRHVRAQYRTNLCIHTKPTARGAESISATDRLNGIRHIQKPIDEIRGQEFLLIMEAEKGRLIDVVLESNDPNWRSNMQQECEDLFLSDRENAVAVKWNDLRKIALTKAIENMLLPAMQHELRAELEFEARERLCDSYRQRFTKRIMRGPYSHRGAGIPELVPDDNYDRGIKVLACVWDRDMKVNKDPTPLTCALLNREGEHKETLELPFMQLPDADRRKMDSCKLLTEFIQRHKPDVVCVATNGRTSENLFNLLATVLMTVPEMPPPVFIDDEPARIYQHSKRAMEEIPDQNTLVKLAVAVGRLAHDPLCEVANLMCDAKDFEQLMVHPLQDMLDLSERMKIADECMVDAVNTIGVEINVACRNKHSSALLRYVSGLGPRKAKSIFDVISASPQQIEFRSALVSQKLVGKTVYISCAGFIRVDHGRLQTDVDYRSDIELLDNAMIHPVDGYDYGKKMALDALDIEPTEDDDMQEMNHKAILQIMQQGGGELDDLDLDAYAGQLEQQGVHNVRHVLMDIRVELQRKWWERQLPWKPLEGAELFQAIAGFHGRDVFVGECEPSYYEGEVDEKQAYVQLDCQLRGRLPVDCCEFGPAMAPAERFRYGQPLFYMMTECTFRGRMEGDDCRFMINVTRSETGCHGHNDEWLDGLNSSVEWQCGILCDTKYALSKQNEDKSKQNAGRNIKQRQIQHPDFQNVTYNGARRYLEGPGQGSDFVIRPSSKGTDHLTITIQFFEDIYLNVDIEERNTTAKSSIGSPLVIENEEYDDLDEVIYRFIHPYVDHARELVAYRKFTDMSREQIISRMKEDLNKGAQQSYYLTVNRDKRYPGRFCLYYMRKGNHHMEDIKCSNKGLRFRNEYFDHPEKLTAYFKKNFNRPPPRKKIERPAAMQKVEPNQQPSRGGGVKKEEPGYWGNTGMPVKGEEEDIKPQLGPGSQSGGWAQPSQQQPQQPATGASQAYAAAAAADAARFAKMQSAPAAGAGQPPPPSNGGGGWVQGGAWDTGSVGGSSGWDQGQPHGGPTQSQPGPMMGSGWGVAGGAQPPPPPAGANQPPHSGWGAVGHQQQQPQGGSGGGWAR